MINKNKKVLIVNGAPGSGKDTFAKIVKKYHPAEKISSIDPIKHIAKLCGWDGVSKTEKDRKFLSDLKLLTTAYSDYSFNYIMRHYKHDFMYETNENIILMIDIREPDDIDRVKNALNADTVLIHNENVEMITSNMADANVYHYMYDYTISNNGTLKQFEDNIKIFLDRYMNKLLRKADE